MAQLTQNVETKETWNGTLILGSGHAGTPLASAFVAGRRTAIIEKAQQYETGGMSPTKSMISSGSGVAHIAHSRAPNDYGMQRNAGSNANISGSGSSDGSGNGNNDGSADSRSGTANNDNNPKSNNNGNDKDEGDDDGVQAEDMVEIRQERKRNVVAGGFSSGNERNRLIEAGVDILKGEATFIGPKTLCIRMRHDLEDRKADEEEHADRAQGRMGRTAKVSERTVTGELVFINVGEAPSRPDIAGLEGIEDDRVLNSTSTMELEAVPKHLIVLGGGYIGLEFGQLFRRLGAQVTIAQRGKRLVPREDPDIAECMLDILTEDGITVHLGCTATAFTPNDNDDDGTLPFTLNIVTDSNESLSIPGSHVLLATGSTLNTTSLNLDAVGINTTPRGHIVVDEKLATTAQGVYALGDVHVGPGFAQMSYDDFRIIRANLIPPEKTPSSSTTPLTSHLILNAQARPINTAASTSKSRNIVPYVIYTDPQLGHVGLHDRDLEDLKKAGRKIQTAKMAISTRGMMKASVDAETGEVLGFTCLGIEGGEVMAIMQVAMMAGVKWRDMGNAVWAHPSLSESLNSLWQFLKES
ncbi:putative fad-dependent pyridine nucleotide-disulfide oxidoreductase [Diplogelasinospora grovesii]|uniref:Fad-dependent pyridine nucleotide-disulfide oxidoreductase n=1 Tax=Diplogelasinospora grovesii TaxID=303347 RepID=A0AAN6NCW4_9PEZI|nr:putative fad-dependent pyridine nucleotide-disulfide oxidoreductase [Diplogelasinospora grovesii]